MEPLNRFQEVEKKGLALWGQIKEWAATPDIYYQLLFVAGACVTALMIVWIGKALYQQLREEETTYPITVREWYIKRALRLIPPILTFIFLGVGDKIASFLTEGTGVIALSRDLSVIWLIIAIISAFVQNTLVRAVGYWLMIPAALLSAVGWFEPTVAFLEEYGFTLGNVEITAYTLLKAIFFASLVVWIGKVISQTVERHIRKSGNLTAPTKELLVKLFDVGLAIILFTATLNLIGIDLTALAVFSGALGVGLGFGLQKVASNFISGIILLSEKSITLNNLIEMDDGIFGYVRKLGARASIVETFDGKEVMVPNEDFITSRVANLTHSTNNGRVDVHVGASYDADPHKVREIMLEAAKSFKDTIQDNPELAPACYLREFADHSVNFLLTFWIPDITAGRWKAQSEVMFTIWDRFKEEGIEIPYPKRDIYFRNGLHLDQPASEKEEGTPASSS